MNSEKNKLINQIEKYKLELLNFEKIDVYAFKSAILLFISENRVLNNKFQYEIDAYEKYKKSKEYKTIDKEEKAYIRNEINIYKTYTLKEEYTKDYKNLYKDLIENDQNRAMALFMQEFNNIENIYKHIYYNDGIGIYNILFKEINKNVPNQELGIKKIYLNRTHESCEHFHILNSLKNLNITKRSKDMIQVKLFYEEFCSICCYNPNWEKIKLYYSIINILDILYNYVIELNKIELEKLNSIKNKLTDSEYHLFNFYSNNLNLTAKEIGKQLNKKTDTINKQFKNIAEKLFEDNCTPMKSLKIYILNNFK